MNPEQAKDVIEKLIEKHGPTCAGANHLLVIRDNKPLLVCSETWHTNDAEICKVGKSGMKNGFTAGLWNEMADALVCATKIRKG